MVTFAQDVYLIYAGRAITGFCIGIISLSLPVYLAEAIHPEVRGTLGLLPTSLGEVICISYRDFFHEFCCHLLFQQEVLSEHIFPS